MARIIIEVKRQEVHKEHKCFKNNSFLMGFYGFSNFCPECGESLLEEKEVKTNRCSECGEILIIKTVFCSNCGVKFDNSPAPLDFNVAFKKPGEYLVQSALKDPGNAIAAFQLVRKALKNIGIRL